MAAVPTAGSLGRRKPRASPSCIPAADLFCEANRLLEAAISENTKAAYLSGIRAFDVFRSGHNRALSWPPCLQDIVDFIAHLSVSNHAPSTAKTYIAGLSYKCKVLGAFDPTQGFIISKLLQGMSRLDKRRDSRLPITLPLLHDIIRILSVVCSSQFEAALFAAAFAVAFFGFFRVGELVSSSGGGLKHVLSISDVNFMRNNSIVELGLRSSKTDASGQGAIVALPAVTGRICPVKLLKRYVSMRPSVGGPLFCHFNGLAVSRSQFNAVLCKACRVLGLDVSKYRSHSFRIGAATLASSKGVSDDEIRMCGRWSSDSKAFKRYIRIPVDNLVA